ncbi:MAG: hypothetical protein QM697_00100 [Lachnospiraceae bacterium]
MDGNYIKINRKMLEWEWYGNINTCRLFIHMLFKANWKDGRFQGKLIKRGSFVSGICTLASETGLTVDETRTAIYHLICTEEITKQSSNKYTIFTVNNYSLYQDIPSKDTNEAQAITKLLPTIEKEKDIKKDIPKGISKEKYFAVPTVEDVRSYCLEEGYTVDAERFVDFYTSKNWMVGKNKMKDWKAAVRGWASRNKETAGQKQNKFNDFNQRNYDFAELEAYGE